MYVQKSKILFKKFVVIQKWALIAPKWGTKLPDASPIHRPKWNVGGKKRRGGVCILTTHDYITVLLYLLPQFHEQ